MSGKIPRWCWQALTFHPPSEESNWPPNCSPRHVSLTEPVPGTALCLRTSPVSASCDLTWTEKQDRLLLLLLLLASSFLGVLLYSTSHVCSSVCVPQGGRSLLQSNIRVTELLNHTRINRYYISEAILSIATGDTPSWFCLLIFIIFFPL